MNNHKLSKYVSDHNCKRCAGTGKEMDPAAIEAIIEASGLTQRALAKALGWKEQFLCDIRKGRERWTPERLEKLLVVIEPGKL